MVEKGTLPEYLGRVGRKEEYMNIRTRSQCTDGRGGTCEMGGNNLSGRTGAVSVVLEEGRKVLYLMWIGKCLVTQLKRCTCGYVHMYDWMISPAL
jgi:hypothetical protein